MNEFYKMTSLFFRKDITYAVIMAMDSRHGIGFNNRLPWKGIVSNKTDMEWFKEKTKGKIVVMGYNTWVSIGRKPLPGRINIVLTKEHVKDVAEDIDRFNYKFLSGTDNNDKKLPVVKTASTPEDVQKFIKEKIGELHNGGEVIVIGGAKIYEAFIPITSRLYLTTFEGEFEADTFVKVDLTGWELRYRDTMQMFQPKFEIWDVTEEVAKRPDSEIMQIEYIHRPAEGLIVKLRQEELLDRPSE